DLQTAGLDDGAVKYIFLLQFDDSAVGFHSARGNVLDAPIIQIGNIDAALRFATTLSKYLYPQVMIKDCAQRATIDFVGDFYFPKDGFGVGVFLNNRCFQGQVSRIEWAPVFGCKGQDREQENQTRLCRQIAERT